MKSSEQYVIAIDAGTTTLAASLIEPTSGRRLAARSALNPQGVFGADVVSRLAYGCAAPENLQRLNAVLKSSLNDLVLALLADAGVEASSLGRIALAGNPAMEHFLLGLPVNSLAFPPYRPLFSEGRTVSTSELGWRVATDLYVFPLPGGFVGGDLVAFLYGQGVANLSSPVPGPRLFIDIGTNAEIALTMDSVVFATSAAAGPALEGGNLACGMAALPGAISSVIITDDRLKLTVIGGGRPAGICGSAVLDLLGELLAAGVIDATGRLLSAGDIPSNLATRLRERDGSRRFTLYRDAEREIFISQDDIRQVQLAKAAIRAGIEVLMRRSGIQHETLREVVLTGAFGAELRGEGLKNVGILTEKMVKVISFVREGVLCGLEKTLCDPEGFETIEHLASTIKIIPLSGNPAFEKLFLEHVDLLG